MQVLRNELSAYKYVFNRIKFHLLISTLSQLNKSKSITKCAVDEIFENVLKHKRLFN